MAHFRVCLDCFSPLYTSCGTHSCTQPDDACDSEWDKEGYEDECNDTYGTIAGVPEDKFKLQYENLGRRRSVTPTRPQWDAIHINSGWPFLREVNKRVEAARRNGNYSEVDLKADTIPDGCDCPAPLCTWRGSAYCAHPYKEKQ